MTSIVGLTGGIASGKSTVSRIWRELGVTVVDADQLAREVVAPGSEGLQEVVEVLGPQALTPDGSMDRKAVGAMVFGDAAARWALNRVIHPRVAALAQERLSEATGAFAVYDVPLLVETEGYKTVDRTVVVAIDEAIQIARAMERDGLDEAAIKARIDAQAPLYSRLGVADLVIWNNGTLAELETAARDTYEKLARLYQ